MTTSYPEYKETNLPWLLRIPKHWEIVRGKNLYSKVERPTTEQDEVVTCFRDGQVTLRKKRRLSGFTESLKEIGYQGIRKGDLVIHVMDAFAGAVGVSDSDGKGTPVYSVCIAKQETTNNYYYAYVIREMAKRGYIQSLYRGIRERSSDFRFEVFAAQELPVPSPAEQAQIVRYLDAMTAKINRLIRAKKKAIALLQEQKQAIINQAVTKGLNPNAEMKDSGIDWIGRVPKHWEIVPIKYCSEILPGFAFDSQKFVSHGKYFLLRGINVGIGKISHDNAVFWNDNIDESVNAFQLKKNDIVLGLDRPWIKNGLRIAKIEECDIPLLLVQRVCRIRAKESMENDFLLVAIQAVLREALETQTTGISVPHISTNQVGNVKIPFPPLEEQREILEDLLSRANTINKSITKILTEIDIVYELKNAYISQVVMGAVDVRSIVIEDFSHEDIDDDFDFSNETENVEECEEYR